MLRSKFLLAFMLTVALAVPTNPKKKQTPQRPLKETLLLAAAGVASVLGMAGSVAYLKGLKVNASPPETGDAPSPETNEVPYDANNQQRTVIPQDPMERRLNYEGRQRYRDCRRMLVRTRIFASQTTPDLSLRLSIFSKENPSANFGIIALICFDYGRYRDWTVEDVYEALGSGDHDPDNAERRRSTDSDAGGGNSLSQFSLDVLKTAGRYLQGDKARPKGAALIKRPLVMRPGW